MPLEFAHLGEVTFINDAGTTCPPDMIIQPDDTTDMIITPDDMTGT
jgi:hypothetical protein